MDNNKWVDVTGQYLAFAKSLSFLEVVKHPELDLQETMHAHEINDPKIDPKHDIKQEYTISKMLSQGRLKHPELLSIQDLRNIYAEILKLEALEMQGQPLQQTIYTFTYLYDDGLWQKSLVIEALVQSINTLGTYIYELHKTSCTLKEDDLSFSTFSFKQSLETHDQVSQTLLRAEKQIESRLKEEKQSEIHKEGKELIAHIRFRRALHELVRALGSSYDIKNQPKIDSEMKTFKKRFCELQTMVQKNGLKEAVPEGVFSQSIWKTLRANLSCKTIRKLSIKEAFDEFDNLVYQLELFLPPPSKISDFRNRLDILSYQSINLLAKSYYKVNFFAKENYLLNTVRTEEAFANDVKEWMTVGIELKNHQKFNNLIILTAQSLADTLYKQLGRNSRWFWEISKTYEDFNILLHLCSEIDSVMQQKKKDVFISSWFYNLATTTMIKQMLWGFEQDLYEPTQFHYICYYLQSILHINQKNNNYFLNKLDKAFIQNFNNKTLNKKLKKQLYQGEKRAFADAIFLKGLHYYFRAFYRLLIILISRGHIVDPFQNSLELRINNRFRIFKNIMFLKKLNHDTYVKEVQTVLSDEGKIIDEASQLLKEGKNIFSLFSQFETHETYFKQCQEAVVLEKLCVKLSLVAMTLKFKQAKKFSIMKEYPKFPEICIQ